MTCYYVADVSRRQVQNVTKFVKNVNIIELHFCIWNHHGKCIQISTNIHCIVICNSSNNLGILKFWRKQWLHAKVNVLIILFLMVSKSYDVFGNETQYSLLHNSPRWIILCDSEGILPSESDRIA